MAAPLQPLRPGLRRPVSLDVDDNGAGWRTHQFTFYGDQLTGADATAHAADNLKGRPYRVYDGAGMVQADGFDFKGNPLSTTRTYNTSYTADIDWAAAGADVTSATTLAAMDTAGSALSTTLVFTTSATFDAMGRAKTGTSPTIPGTSGKESVTQYSFNKAGLLQTVKVLLRGSTTEQGVVRSIAYDAKGRRTQIVYACDPKDTVAPFDPTQTFVKTEYTYDERSQRLTQLKTTRVQGSAKLQELNYHYDAAGNIVEVSDGAQQTLFFNNNQIDPTATFTYDGAYRLIQATGREKTPAAPWWSDYTPASTIPGLDPTSYTRDYTYDKVGNITEMNASTAPTRTYTYGTGGDNTLTKTTIGATDYPLTYNARGAMISMPHLDTIRRDFNDQMRQVTKGAGSGAVQGYYAHDSGGQRVRKTIAKTDVEDTFYLGGWELFRKGSSPTQEYETLHVMDDQSRVCVIETLTVDPTATVPATVWRYQLGNHLGSALLELDEEARIISYEEYHPFGTTAWHADDLDTTARRKRYRYTGKEKDEWTGLSYHGARHYAPWLGRWCAADPIGLGDGVNRYAYVGNSPIRSHDPSGRAGEQEEGWFEVGEGRNIITSSGPEGSSGIYVRQFAKASSSEPEPIFFPVWPEQPWDTEPPDLPTPSVVVERPDLVVITISGNAVGSVVPAGYGESGSFITDVIHPETGPRELSVIHIAIASGVFDTTTVDDAISKALPALSFEDQPRTVIWGYSRGGDPAVQTAHALQDRGFDVDRLYLIDPTDYALKALGTEYVIPKNVAGGGVYWQDSPWYNPLPSGAGVARSLRLEDPVATDWQSREFQGGPFWGHGILPRDSNPLLREDIGRALDDWFGLRPVPPVFQFEDQYGR